MRDKLRVHAHLDQPETLFEACARSGRVSSIKADDLRMQAVSAANHKPRRAGHGLGRDLPGEELERLCIHLVPVRVSIGARDYLDKVSLGAREFFREVRDSPVPPRTSQPPPGDFRRLFEFLLSHHEVGGLRRASARRPLGHAAGGRERGERCAPERVRVVDSLSGGCAQGLIALDAAEAAAAGFDAAAVVRRVESMRSAHAAARRIPRHQLRRARGRAPRLAVPLTRLTGLKPIICNKRNGRIGLAGFVRGGHDFPERLAARLARKLERSRRYRVLVTHCDCPDEGERLRARLLTLAPNIERHWMIEAGAAIGAHAGPGSLVVGIQEAVPLSRQGERGPRAVRRKLLAAYLIGSISGSLVLGRLRRVDIREQGSGNAGATNAFRTQGALFALGVVAVDVARARSRRGSGCSTVRCGARAGAARRRARRPAWPRCSGTSGRVLRFRGGKGAGTLVGCVLLLLPLACVSARGWLLMLARPATSAFPRSSRAAAAARRRLARAGQRRLARVRGRPLGPAADHASRQLGAWRRARSTASSARASWCRAASARARRERRAARAGRRAGARTGGGAAARWRRSWA
jgi:DegV family protein with EDD domain